MNRQIADFCLITLSDSVFQSEIPELLEECKALLPLEIDSPIQALPLPSSIEAIAALDVETELLHSYLCFYSEAPRFWVPVPEIYISQLVRLQVAGLIQLRIGAAA